MRGKHWNQMIRKWGITGLILACILCSCINVARSREDESDKQSVLMEKTAILFRKQMERAYFQLPTFLEEKGTGGNLVQGLENCMWKEFPLYHYAVLIEEEQPRREDLLTAERIVQHEGVDEDCKNIEEEKLDYGEDALHIEGSVLDEMKRENSLHNTDEDDADDPGGEEQQVEDSKESLPVPFQMPHIPSYTYDWSEEWDYEAMVSNFYAVDSATRLKEEYVGLNQLLYQDLSVDRSVEGPQILIYHTHASEKFADSVDGDSSTTIVGAGEKLTELLQEKYGFQVLHHTGVYDAVREDAYAKALPEIEEVLAENPTIEVVIDLHRDAVSGERKLVMDLQGRPTARFMFFNGLSCSRKSGDIAYLENPYIQENLSFSFQAQVAANEYYPGIARKIYLKAYRYNLHLKPKSMLIELGAQNNTVEEIMNACDPLAHILAIVLDGDL